MKAAFLWLLLLAKCAAGAEPHFTFTLTMTPTRTPTLTPTFMEGECVGLGFSEQVEEPTPRPGWMLIPVPYRIAHIEKDGYLSVRSPWNEAFLISPADLKPGWRDFHKPVVGTYTLYLPPRYERMQCPKD